MDALRRQRVWRRAARLALPAALLQVCMICAAWRQVYANAPFAGWFLSAIPLATLGAALLWAADAETGQQLMASAHLHN